MRILIALLLTVFSFSAHAQYFWNESFEYPNDNYRNDFIIDTVSYHHNLWEIGQPHKKVFDAGSAYSPPNVIITDTLNPYPKSDTSVFIIKHGYIPTGIFSLNFEYQLDIDSGVLAKVEVSGDSGRTWINTMTQDTTYMFYWGYGKPRLDTSVLTWHPFQLNMEVWANAVAGGPDTFPSYRTSDTILFRFTFISDTDTTGKDGWMMDNFYVENAIMEGSVKQVLNNNMVNVYPVPSRGYIYYHSTGAATDKANLIIYNMKGEEVYKMQDSPPSGNLNLPLANGSYILKYSTDKDYALKRIIILR